MNGGAKLAYSSTYVRLVLACYLFPLGIALCWHASCHMLRRRCCGPPLSIQDRVCSCYICRNISIQLQSVQVEYSLNVLQVVLHDFGRLVYAYKHDCPLESGPTVLEIWKQVMFLLSIHPVQLQEITEILRCTPVDARQ